MLGMLPPSDLSLAVKLASNVLKAIPCPDPLVMGLAAKVYGMAFGSGVDLAHVHNSSSRCCRRRTYDRSRQYPAQDDYRMVAR